MATFNTRKLRYDWRNGGPVITYAIIALCVLIWLLGTVLRLIAPFIYQSVVGSGLFIPLTAVSHPWTWLTSMFLHAPNLMHVGFNMLALWSVGPVLERMMGHWNFLALYLISGLGGAAGLVVWARVTGAWLSGAYGASGALFGLFAAVLIVFRRIGIDIRSMLIWMAVNFALPLIVPNVAWQDHVGGFLIGGLLTWLLVSGVPRLRRLTMRRRMWVYGGCVAVALAVVIVACVASVTVI
ncbi:rhomboid family intramembrane serine protease [Bifidobacterium sp.]|jgi:membrane associated rhomboid family serine protease|uniref:rhomboid family intramembrane serine protease n=1 Tax=Bifidobacterium sp. TaxID=41200 RepID=UPI0025C73C49|nr:rhomboid family intramembrane serine protease [Bifidobacterium sp.]MCH4209682.1 rhomboid family intramembrane serine protease [Bifidobacterium sp.]